MHRTAFSLLVAASSASLVGHPADVRADGSKSAIFDEQAVDLGLDFVHFNGMSGEFYFSETVGPGVALFDYDNDGDLDVYLVQGRMLGRRKTVAEATLPPEGPLRDRLWRNDLEDSPAGPRVRFVEVTEESGLVAESYGMGVSAGDVDNDGWIDLYVTNFGSNQLWRNAGPGSNGAPTFVDITESAGVDDVRWSVPSTFVDIDLDGLLDLFVGNYTDYTLESHKLCRTLAGAPDYCGPLSYPAEPDRLFRNLGSGSGALRFEDLTARSRISSEFGGALGAVAADFNADGMPDLYVANDGMPNQMWINGGDGRFTNDALLAGTGVNMLGQPEASMGVTVADFDADGDEDIFLTHLSRETNTLYENDGTGLFEDRTFESGLGGPSLPFTGFGTAWLDYDNDGWLDLLAANGEVRVIPELEAAGDPHPLHQKNQLYRNVGGRFEEVTAEAGSAFADSEVSRGLAVGDIDNDGDTDVVLMNNGGRTRLLVNRIGQDSAWLGLRLVTGEPRVDAIGAWAGLERDGEPTLWRRVSTGGSYLSASDPRLLFGLGNIAVQGSVVVHWPGGSKERFAAEPGRYTTLVAGKGEALR